MTSFDGVGDHDEHAERKATRSCAKQRHAGAMTCGQEQQHERTGGRASDTAAAGTLLAAEATCTPKLFACVARIEAVALDENAQPFRE